MRVRVKICGITRGVDVDLAVAAGADAIGMVFWPASSRAVTLASARQLRAAVPAFVTAVALFVNPTVAEVQRVLDQVVRAVEFLFGFILFTDILFLG